MTTELEVKKPMPGWKKALILVAFIVLTVISLGSLVTTFALAAAWWTDRTLPSFIVAMVNLGITVGAVHHPPIVLINNVIMYIGSFWMPREVPSPQAY